MYNLYEEYLAEVVSMYREMFHCFGFTEIIYTPKYTNFGT